MMHTICLPNEQHHILKQLSSVVHLKVEDASFYLLLLIAVVGTV